MAFASLLLVVLASFIHASWNLLAKRAASVGPIFVFAYNLIACIAYAPWVLYVLVQGDGIAWTWIVVGFLLLSGLIHLAYSLCLQRGYQVADLSVVYPVARGTGPMLSTLGAFLILSTTLESEARQCGKAVNRFGGDGFVAQLLSFATKSPALILQGNSCRTSQVQKSDLCDRFCDTRRLPPPSVSTNAAQPLPTHHGSCSNPGGSTASGIRQVGLNGRNGGAKRTTQCLIDRHWRCFARAGVVQGQSLPAPAASQAAFAT